MNNNGFILKLPIYILAIIGALLLYKSFEAKNISTDISYMLKESQQMLQKAHLTETDRKKVEDSFSTIHNIARNNGILTDGYK